MCICLVHNKHLKVLESLISLVFTYWHCCCKYMLFKRGEKSKRCFLHYCIFVSFKAARANIYNCVSLEARIVLIFFKLIPTLLPTVCLTDMFSDDRDSKKLTRLSSKTFCEMQHSPLDTEQTGRVSLWKSQKEYVCQTQS